MIDFSKKGKERYGSQNRYQKLCQNKVRERLSSLRREYPNHIFDLDDSGQYIEAYHKVDPNTLPSVTQKA